MKSIIKKIKKLFFLLPFLPIILLIRAIGPLKLIRFGSIPSHTFGHFIRDVELYLTERHLKNKNSLDFFFYDYKYKTHKDSVNTQWDLMVRRHLRVCPLVSYLYRANQMIPGGKANHITMGLERSLSRDFEGIFYGTRPQMSFTEEENERGRQYLHDIGLRSGEMFVCIIVRDSAYKEKYRNWKSDWSYHNYRDSDIDSYEDAAIALADKGYWVFRMGKAVNKPLNIDHPKVLDYANSIYRSDFLDIWLLVNCYFALSTTTGLGDLAFSFRKPLALVNSSPLGTINSSFQNSIWLPKKIVWMSNQKPLNLKEQIETGVIGYMRSELYEKAGVDLIDNTNLEIRNSALELESKLAGTWDATTEDEKFQNKFWSILKTWDRFPEFQGKIQSRIPDFWLRQNHNWFLA